MYIRFSFFVALFTFLPFSVFAASYSFAEGTSTDSEGKHEVVLLFSADTPINALQGVFMLPDTDKDTKISDGGSVVQFWIEHPNNENGKVSFAGVVPGGFSGEALVLRFRMKGSAKSITLDKTKMVALRHDGTGEPDHVVIGPVGPIPPRFASNSVVVSSQDTTPPQVFVPVVASDPNLFEGKPFVSFGAKDEGSGITQYEIAESRCDGDVSDPSLVWRVVESPALLQSTETGGCVYVRAKDNEGNVRVVSTTLTPSRNSLPEEVPALLTARNLYKIGILLGIIVITFGGLYFYVRQRKMFSK
jgi:hypothetical protein